MNNYQDIIDMPRHISKNRKHMSNHDRAAQFAPFAALVGFSDKIDEASRITSDLIEISDDEKEILNQKLLFIDKNIFNKIQVKVTYFVPDEYKDGGAYKTETIIIKRIDLLKRIIISEDNRTYDLDYILDIDSDIFNQIVE